MVKKKNLMGCINDKISNRYGEFTDVYIYREREREGEKIGPTTAMRNAT